LKTVDEFTFEGKYDLIL